MSVFCDGQLIRYSSVVATKVEWLWYPYIPLGKITLLQGDPGSGKSTLIMSIISAISSGNATPGGNHQNEPMRIYTVDFQWVLTDTYSESPFWTCAPERAFCVFHGFGVGERQLTKRSLCLGNRSPYLN